MRTIQGTKGPDSLTGGGVSDLIFGHGGNDTIRAGSGSFTEIFGDGGDDLVFAQRGHNEFISGGTGDDTIRMGQHAASAYAGRGRDVVYAGKGNSYLLGGSGNDTLIETGAESAYSMTIDDNGFTHINRIDGSQGEVIERGFEHIQFAAELPTDDSVNIPTNNSVDPAGANDLIQGGGNDLVVKGVIDFIGRGVNDLVGETVPTDDGLPESGSDTVGGETTVPGGPGTDTLPGGGGGTIIGGGSDSVGGGTTMRGGSETDTLPGGDSGDTIVGGGGSVGGDTTVPGGSGTDTLPGGDTIIGGGSDTVIAGRSGIGGGMTVTGSSGSTVPRGGASSLEAVFALTPDYEAIPQGGATPTYPAGNNTTPVPSILNTVVSGDGEIALTLQPYLLPSFHTDPFSPDAYSPASVDQTGNVVTATYTGLPSAGATNTIVAIGSPDDVGAFLDGGGEVDFDVTGTSGQQTHLHLARDKTGPGKFNFVDQNNTVAIGDNNFVSGSPGKTLAVGNSEQANLFDPSGAAGLVKGAEFSFALTAKQDGTVVAGLVSRVTLG